MAKGAIAKENVAKIIAQAFGSNFVGEYDKKLYVWSNENGEKIQVAISMTCPKSPVGGDTGKIDFSAEPGGSLNFEDMSAASSFTGSYSPVEITEDEKDNIAKMMERLGL